MMEDLSKRTAILETKTQAYAYYPIDRVEGASQLPLSLKVLLENVLRMVADDTLADTLAKRIILAAQMRIAGDEIEFSPSRVLLQDFTGVPVFVDFAIMREACKKLGGDPATINPLVPCDLVIDHSVIADSAGSLDAVKTNMRIEHERNHERYAFLKWAQASFKNVRIVPPGAGICHQLNIEQFAHVVMTSEDAGIKTSRGELPLAYFDTLVGTDSHTPTANGLGVLGWGVGGIEAEAAALGQPITTLVPKVVGIRLSGYLSDGVSGMDVALAFAQTLRTKGVVGSFVECFGEGLSSLSATQRACIANMTPEYGCTSTLFPVDERTIEYMKLTGRSAKRCELIEAYAKAQGYWSDPACDIQYAEVIDLDLSQIEPALAGPSRPHDRILLTDAHRSFRRICADRGLDEYEHVKLVIDGHQCELTHGALAIAAVTSCTTATDPVMMIAAGLLARKAAARGLTSKPWVKTILAPGSRATELLLVRAGLMEGLRTLGFYTCGFGCMSCIGNSGSIKPELHDVADRIELASVLSGNRNFEGRISPDVSQNYLAAPVLVIAYALAGTVDIDLTRDALGVDKQGKEVFLADIMPNNEEISRLMNAHVDESLYADGAKGTFGGDRTWRNLPLIQSDLFAWDKHSTYVRRAPYFDTIQVHPAPIEPLRDARVIALLGDFITTDHISPAGAIAAHSVAASYLRTQGVADTDFNTYGSRRGNHEVMMRGTFANVKLLNILAEGRRGGWTRDFEDNTVKPLFDVACSYVQKGTPLVVIAGKMYGSGSSRDWAAKGPALIGVRAVIAESFERIHRSNLIGMGVLPLQFLERENAAILGIDGTECFSVAEIDFSQGMPHPHVVVVTAVKPDGRTLTFEAKVRIDTPTEGRYFAHGGILPYVLRQLVNNTAASQ